MSPIPQSEGGKMTRITHFKCGASAPAQPGGKHLCPVCVGPCKVARFETQCAGCGKPIFQPARGGGSKFCDNCNSPANIRRREQGKAQRAKAAEIKRLKQIEHGKRHCPKCGHRKAESNIRKLCFKCSPPIIRDHWPEYEGPSFPEEHNGCIPYGRGFWT
jgi:hypothetical protein